MCGSSKATGVTGASASSSKAGANDSARKYVAAPPKGFLLCGVVDTANCRCSSNDGDASDEQLPGVICASSDEPLHCSKSSSSTSAPVPTDQEAEEEQTNICIRTVKPMSEESTAASSNSVTSVEGVDEAQQAVADSAKVLSPEAEAAQAPEVASNRETEEQQAESTLIVASASGNDNAVEETMDAPTTPADATAEKKNKPAAKKATAKKKPASAKSSTALESDIGQAKSEKKKIKKAPTKETDADAELKAAIERERKAPRSAKARGFKVEAHHNVEDGGLEYKDGKLVIASGAEDSDTDDEFYTAGMTAVEKEIYYERKRVGVKRVPKQDCAVM